MSLAVTSDVAPDWTLAERDAACRARGLDGQELVIDPAVDLATLAARGTGLSHNPVSNAYYASGVARLPELLKAGVRVGLGVDGASTNNGQNVWETMKMAMLFQKQFREKPDFGSAELALELMTRGGAAALHMEDEIGSLEPGKRAKRIDRALASEEEEQHQHQVGHAARDRGIGQSQAARDGAAAQRQRGEDPAQQEGKRHRQERDGQRHSHAADQNRPIGEDLLHHGLRLSITVRGPVEHFKPVARLPIKDDRGNTLFKVTREEDVPAALDLIFHAKRKRE